MHFYLCNEGEKFEWYDQGENRRKMNALGKSVPTLVMGRNDRAAFQVIAVHPEDEYCISISESAYFCAEGNFEILRFSFDAPHAIEAKIEGFADCEDGRHYNDILEDRPHCAVLSRRKISLIWVEIIAPDTAVPGVYEGSVRVYVRRATEEERVDAVLKFSYEVIDCRLDDPSENPFVLDLWQHNCNIARKHETDFYDDAHFEVLERYISSLSQLGAKAITVVASEAPWGNAFVFNEQESLSDLYEYSMIDVRRGTDGTLSVNFHKMRRYIELCFRYGIRETIEIFGLLNILECEDEGFAPPIKDYSDGVRVRYYDETDGCYRFLTQKCDFETYVLAIYRYFREEGLLAKVRIAADEPADADAFWTRLEYLHTLCPEFRFQISLFHVDIINRLVARGIDFAAALQAIPAMNEQARKVLCEQRESRYLYYVCCGPQFPNTFLRSPLLECRLLPMLAALIGADGLLRWNYTVWPKDPRNKLSYKSYILPSGDTNFVYPSSSGRPLLSLRWKMLRRGIDDYGLFKRVAEDVREQALEKLFKTRNLSVYFSPDAQREALYSLCYEDYVQVKRILLEALATSKRED